MAGTSTDRIVVLIDMDCFFCQVESKLNPELVGKPLAVVQYNQWKLGGIIAVNYEARDYGVTRHMRGEEAKEKCPDLLLASVPCLRGKADTSRYRSAGREVIDAIRKHCTVIERASVDEAYLDITDIVNKRIALNPQTPSQLIKQLSNTFVVGYSEIGKNEEEERRKGLEIWMSNVFEELEDVKAQKLAVAGIIVEEIRADVYKETGFRCSAGIAENKILAKLACGLHKPNRQTILPPAAVSELYSTLPVKKVRNLGGKFGDVVVESLNCNVMGDLLQYSLQYLQKRFDDKTGLWLYNIARGIDNEPVTTRLVSKSIGACKKFPGKQAIVSLDVLKHWAGELSAEVCERLEQDMDENERRATLLTVCYHYYQNRSTISQSRSCTLNSYKPEKMANRCVDIITKSTHCPVAYLGISVGKFIPAKGSGNFMNFFKSDRTKDCEKISIELKSGKDDVTEISPNIEADKINKTCQKSCTVTEDNKCPKSMAANNKTLIKINEKNISNTHVKLNESPTSRRVTNLIQYLNDQNNAKTLHKDAMSKRLLNESLDQDKFKGSFFMNILNEKESVSENGEQNHFEQLSNSEDTKEDNCKPTNRASTSKDDYHLVEEESLLNHKNVTSSEKGEDFPLHIPYSNTEEKSGNQMSSVESSSVQLQEIFPDLNNIDPTIVLLLPPDLQEEARLYMKLHAKNDVKAVESTTKNLKSKNNKSKANPKKAKKGNDMYTFLVKENSNNSADMPLKRCTQCNQMISITKYEEHSDFHVAENIQRQLNNSVINNTGIKRKVDSTNADPTSIKRRPTINVSKLNKNCKLITTFLS